jgi:hypothetical protein
LEIKREKGRPIRRTDEVPQGPERRPKPLATRFFIAASPTARENSDAKSESSKANARNMNGAFSQKQ